MRTPKTWALVVVAAMLAVSGCRSGIKDDPILRLAAEESLALGKELMQAEKFTQARPYLEHAFEVAPNSPIGREALLLAADSLYLAGGTDNLIQAEAKYRDFQNRFPTAEHAAYVEFQIASSLARRMRRPDRDQTVTFKALASFEQVLRLYPTSEYAPEAREQIVIVRDNLAEAEERVGTFYLHRRLNRAAATRFETVLEDYPEFSGMERVLFGLGKAYLRMEQAEKAEEMWSRLRDEYPESAYLAKVDKAKGKG